MDGCCGRVSGRDAGASIALENVDEALEANRRLQKKLKRMIRQLCEAHDQFSVLRVTLCMPPSSSRGGNGLSGETRPAFIALR
ncbi:hypothetical protein TcBrA4_0099380 [Trypanosoma cruzi]|nr:hypothetical protein TcBrA4_0099380 [Trypanosoma cruzi]